MSEIAFVDLGENWDAGLLEQAYRDVYLPAFPLRDEQEDPSIWTPRLLDPQANPRLSYLVATTQTGDPGRRRVLGLLVAEYYAASQCVLLSYVAVAARGQGLARRLFEQLRVRLAAGRASRGRPVQAVFAEIHDPSMGASGDDVLDPHVRLRIMARLGGRRVPMRYLQPALGPGQAPAGGLCLIAFPALAPNAPPLTPGRIRDFLVEFYRELGSAQPLQDPLYAPTFADVDALQSRPMLLEPLVDEPRPAP
ncbi:MAG TPA: hypothetical protein VFG44_03610 [Burkholderiales bacterium]|nr:hypothetical protein [Burkholderiales bacterium]